MISSDTLFLFISAAMALSLAPGPDNLFVLTQSAIHGRTSGLWVTLGICLGLVIHTLLVALGVAALIAASPVAFSLLKLAGAVYLCYLAWRTFQSGPADLAQEAITSPHRFRLVARGWVMNLTNPKVLVFFLAFLPQFVDAGRGSVPVQLILLGLVFMGCAALVFSGAALAGAALAQRLRTSAPLQRWLNRCAGSVFLLLALRLLWAE